MAFVIVKQSKGSFSIAAVYLADKMYYAAS
jgi:hypothetical protein